MSKSNAYEADVLAMELNGTSIAGLCTATADDLQLHLHTADPGEAGLTTTSPATYTGYAPVTIARPNANFTVTAGSAVNAIAFAFPQNTGANQDVFWFSISRTGDTTIMRRGQINGASGQTIATNMTPSFNSGALTITED